MEKEFDFVDDRRIGGYLIQDIEAFVGPKSEVYIDKFVKLEEKGYSFNWCSTLFSSNWFAYRKMWNVVIIFLLIQLISGPLLYFGVGAFITHFGTTNVMFRFIMTFLFAFLVIEGVILGLFGDWFYWRYVKKMLDSCNCKDRDPGEDFTYVKTSLSESGGISYPGLIAAYVAAFILIRLISHIGTYILNVFFYI